MINGKTKVFGLFGNPVEHTISPYIHQLIYEELAYDGTYNPFYVRPGKLKNAVDGIRGLNLKGVNITVPYKVEVMAYLDEVDDLAKGIGAVNTVVPIQLDDHTDYILKGYNTDWLGLAMACDYDGIPIEGKDVVIIGAGGSARAVAFMCANRRASSILILNRTIEKAVEIKDSLERGMDELGSLKDLPIHVAGLGDLDLVKEDVVVFQTTSLGMYPKVDKTPIDDEDFFDKVDFIVDIIYNPKETIFMQMGKNHGAKVANGLGMLFFQAVKAFELWTNMTLDDDQLKNVFGKLEKFVYEK